ncbi:MAG: hypothetical protein ACRD51_17105, partial [Candidatus Acidiferrum sp.]
EVVGSNPIGSTNSLKLSSEYSASRFIVSGAVHTPRAICDSFDPTIKNAKMGAVAVAEQKMKAPRVVKRSYLLREKSTTSLLTEPRE